MNFHHHLPACSRMQTIFFQLPGQTRHFHYQLDSRRSCSIQNTSSKYFSPTIIMERAQHSLLPGFILLVEVVRYRIVMERGVQSIARDKQSLRGYQHEEFE
jgi:hypothetical protein